MLYEKVTGRPPFLGDGSVAIIGQHINTPPVALTWHNDIVGINMGKAQGIIQLSNGQESGVGNDGGTVKLWTDFGIELESERGLVAVTHRVLPGCLGHLTKPWHTMV